MTKSGFLEVGGARLYYEEAGHGTPLVMLHGGLLDATSWDAQFDVLSAGYHAVRYDARHHGRSESGPGEFSNFEDLRGVLDALEIDQAIIMGLSLGARTAIDFAISYPNRVAALVLVSPGASGLERHSEAFAAHSQEFVRSFQDGLEAAVDYFLRWTLDGPTRSSSAVDASVREKARTMAATSVVKQRSGNVLKELDPPAVGRLPEIQPPTLVVTGELDQPYIQELGRLVAAEAQDAEIALIPHAAHMVNMEAPEAFTEVILRFLAGR